MKIFILIIFIINTSFGDEYSLFGKDSTASIAEIRKVFKKKVLDLYVKINNHDDNHISYQEELESLRLAYQKIKTNKARSVDSNFRQPKNRPNNSPRPSSRNKAIGLYQKAKQVEQISSLETNYIDYEKMVNETLSKLPKGEFKEFLLKQLSLSSPSTNRHYEGLYLFYNLQIHLDKHLSPDLIAKSISLIGSIREKILFLFLKSLNSFDNFTEFDLKNSSNLYKKAVIDSFNKNQFDIIKLVTTLVFINKIKPDDHLLSNFSLNEEYFNSKFIPIYTKELDFMKLDLNSYQKEAYDFSNSIFMNNFRYIQESYRSQLEFHDNRMVNVRSISLNYIEKIKNNTDLENFKKFQKAIINEKFVGTDLGVKLTLLEKYFYRSEFNSKLHLFLNNDIKTLISLNLISMDELNRFKNLGAIGCDRLLNNLLF